MAILKQHSYNRTKAFRERKLNQGQNLIRDSKPDFRINPNSGPDTDVCRIAHEMYWIHSLVDLSHFAKYRKQEVKVI